MRNNQVRNDERRVARGEYPLYAPHNFAFFKELDGLPVRFVFPADGSPNADTQAVVARVSATTTDSAPGDLNSRLHRRSLPTSRRARSDTLSIQLPLKGWPIMSPKTPATAES